MEDNGLEAKPLSSGNSTISQESGAESGSPGAPGDTNDPRLIEIVEAWTGLPETLKADLLASVRKSVRDPAPLIIGTKDRVAMGGLPPESEEGKRKSPPGHQGDTRGAFGFRLPVQHIPRLDGLEHRSEIVAVLLGKFDVGCDGLPVQALCLGNVPGSFSK